MSGGGRTAAANSRRVSKRRHSDYLLLKTFLADDSRAARLVLPELRRRELRTLRQGERAKPRERIELRTRADELVRRGESPPPWQEEQAAAIRIRWRAQMLAPGPTLREPVERLVRERYRLLGFPRRPQVVWCSGPLDFCKQALVARRGLVGEELTLARRLNGRLWRRLERWLPQEYGRGPFNSFHDPILRDVWTELFFSQQERLGEQGWRQLEDVVWQLGWIPGHGIVTGPELADGWRLTWPAFWSYLDEIELRLRARPLRPLLELSRSVAWWESVGATLLLCERPLVSQRDEQGRPHAGDGPAFRFADGSSLYAWHGLFVPAELIEQPATRERISGTQNQEWRRVLLERYGVARYLSERGKRPIAEDECGRLWRLERRDETGFPLEPLVVVEVENATLEPDGTRRRYSLRVPPEMRSPREAVAWTFALGSEEYRPERES